MSEIEFAALVATIRRATAEVRGGDPEAVERMLVEVEDRFGPALAILVRLRLQGDGATLH